MNATAAYEAGKHLAVIRWYVTQTILRHSSTSLKQAEEAVRKLSVKVRETVNTLQTQDSLQHEILACWQRLDPIQFVSDDYIDLMADAAYAAHQSAAPGGDTDQIYRQYCRDFALPAEEFVWEVQTLIDSHLQVAFQEKQLVLDFLRRSIRFGTLVNEGLYRADIADHIYKNPGGGVPQSKEMEAANKEDATKSTSSGLGRPSTEDIEDPDFIMIYQIEPGTLPVRAGWLGADSELNQRWNELHFETVLPVDDYVRRLATGGSVAEIIRRIDEEFVACAPNHECYCTIEIDIPPTGASATITYGDQQFPVPRAAGIWFKAKWETKGQHKSLRQLAEVYQELNKKKVCRLMNALPPELRRLIDNKPAGRSKCRR